MRRQLTRISPLSAVVILLFAAAMTYFVFRAFAASGTATLYTSPSGTQAVSTGQSFSVSVRVSSGANVPVTGASVYLSYPADKLQVTGVNYSGSPYTTQLIESNSGGILRMDRAALPAVSGGDQLFAQVSFKALAAGSASLSFTGSSLVTSGEDDSNILAQRSGVTYTISTPSTPPPTNAGGGSSGGSTSGGTSGGGSTSSGSGSSSGGSSKPTTPGSRPTTPSTGGSTSSGNSSGGSSQGSSGGSESAPVTGDDGTPISEGSVSVIEIAILDSKNKPVKGAEVTLNGQTVKTDENGIAHFDGVPAGHQTIAIKYNGKKTNKVVQVKGASTTASPEKFNVSIPRDKFNPAVLAIPVLVLGAAVILFLKPWSGRFATSPAGAFDKSEDIVTSDRLYIQTPTNTAKQAPGSIVAPNGSEKDVASTEPQTTIKPEEPPKQ